MLTNTFLIGLANEFKLMTFLESVIASIKSYGAMIVAVLGVVCLIAGIALACLKLFAKQGQFSQKFPWAAVVVMLVVGAVLATMSAGKAIESVGSGIGSEFRYMGDSTKNYDKKNEGKDQPYSTKTGTILPGMSWYSIPENPQLSDFM